MLSPSPVSLSCAVLICLPLALVFIFTTTTGGSTTIPTTTTTIIIPTTNETKSNPLTKIKPNTIQIQPKVKNQSTISSSLPPPPFQEDDESLFRRAAQADPNPSTIGLPRKLAFMFLTTTPLPFAPLWELFFNHTPTELYNIYIHADPTFDYEPPFRGVFSNRLIPSKPTRRNTPTLISAARRLLSHALLQDPYNSMFALLSAACVPLHSFNFTYSTLVGSKKSFIEILENEPGAYDRWAARGEDAMLPEVALENFRIGSQFFVLTRRHARMVVTDTALWGKFKLPCLRVNTCFPEEHYFPTLLNMKDPRGCVPATLTHVEWKGSRGGHPRTYGAADVGPGMIAEFRARRPRYGRVADDGTNGSDSSVPKRNDPFLFARKFAPESIEPLLSMANDVIFRD